MVSPSMMRGTPSKDSAARDDAGVVVMTNARQTAAALDRTFWRGWLVLQPSLLAARTHKLMCRGLSDIGAPAVRKILPRRELAGRQSGCNTLEDDVIIVATIRSAQPSQCTQ
mmetsp:Transcript_16345/g.49015  ORF Transcript_16345/g.49015 Transcript_16345/m.49015 type:complete len:112 (+) Transcript_16345:2980-3315(+)